MHRSHVRPDGLRRLALVAAALTLLLAAVPRHAAGAEAVKPWSPPADSIARLANSARLRFQRQKGDSVVGDNFDGYEIVGDLGRKMLARLGRSHWNEAASIQATLDSLGLDVEISSDPLAKSMVFMLVRNPFMRSSDAVGYIYWLRGPELRMQGASYPPAQDFSVRFWWTGRQDAPYEALTLYRGRKDEHLALRLYRLNDAGVLWNLVQYEGNSPDLGSSTGAAFADVNRDGLPEVLAYHTAEPDTFLKIAPEAPQLIQEYLYTERPEGFVVHDMRELPGPSSTVNLFASLLLNHEPDLARRLLVHPEKLDSVLALGWGQHHGRGDWNIEYGEAQPWPEWLELKIRQDTGWKHWIFHFWIKDGRWVIRDWIPVQPPSPTAVVKPGAPNPAPAGGKSP